MATFTSGQTLTLPLDYDDYIIWQGQGVATITPSTGSVTTTYLTGSQTLGPYKQYVTISIVTSSTGSYTQNSQTAVDTPAVYSTDSSNNVTGLVGQGGLKIAIGVIGQSNERGQIPTNSQAAYPQCFGSLRKPGNIIPIGPSVTVNGGWWGKVYDDLYDYGYDATIVNGAIGSMGMIRNCCGWGEFWNANQASPAANPIARLRRAAIAGVGDYGDNGTVMVRGISGGKTGVFYCSAGGASVYSSYSSASPIPSSSPTTYNLDYIYAPAAGGTGAATDPFAAYAGGVGGTVTDGALTWTCVNADVAGATDTAFTALSQGGAFQDGKFGFDPMGICHRLHAEMQRVQGVTQKWIYIQNAQSDEFAGTQTWYQSALTNVAQWFLNRNYKVMIGLSCYDNSGSNVTNYNGLQTQKNAVLAAFSGNSNVKAGADLYALMGSTAGSNGLTYQADNVHLDAPAALIAGGYISSAFKSVLAKNT